MKIYSVPGFWQDITLCPTNHELMSAQRVDFQLKKYVKLYHPVIAQRSGSSATDAMVDFFELKPENSTLSAVVYDLTAAKIPSIKTVP